MFRSYLILFIGMSLLWSCADDEQIPQQLPNFESHLIQTIPEILIADRKFNKSNGTLVILDDKKQEVHVQVSTQVFAPFDITNVDRQSKQDIIYAAFLSFFFASDTEFTISSVPLLMADVRTRDRYLDEHAFTYTIQRKTGSKIIQRYFDDSAYETLFTFDDQTETFVPNERFKQLMHELLDDTFRLLVKD